MKRFFGRRKKLATKETELKERIGKASILVYSPEFKKFVRNNRSVLTNTYRLVWENFERLQRGKEIVDKKTGIRIVREATGSFKGTRAIFTLKVTVGNKEFFVKAFTRVSEAMGILAGYRKANAFLKQKNYRFGGYNVRVIKPHLIISKSRPFFEGKPVRAFLVTDFYRQGEVIQVRDLKKREFDSISSVLYKLKSEIFREAVGVADVLFREAVGVADVFPENAFFEPKTNTILLFDIVGYPDVSYEL